jgi:hypothetical protein
MIHISLFIPLLLPLSLAQIFSSAHFSTFSMPAFILEPEYAITLHIYYIKHNFSATRYRGFVNKTGSIY